MTTGRILELVAAVLIFGAAVWLYRRKPADAEGGYGNQGAVILLVIAVIMAIHALGFMEYRPSESELELMKERAQ